MAFNWAGGGQSPFSPNPLPGWGSEATRPSFGAQPGGSPFTPASSGGFFQSTSAFGAPSTGGSLFGGQTGFGGGFGGFGTQSSGFAFQQPQSTSSVFDPSTLILGPKPTQQPQQPPQWTTQPQPPQPPTQTPFRYEFYRVVKRKDGRAVTHHTGLDELEDLGQNAIRMIQQEQGKYRTVLEEISKDAWFKRDADSDQLKNVFDGRIAETRKQIAEHRLNVDAFAGEVHSAGTDGERIDRAIRDAEYLANELEKTASAQDEGRLYSTEIKHPFGNSTPHPFVAKKAKELRARVQKLLRETRDAESLANDQNGGAEQDEIVGELETFELVHRISTALRDKLDRVVSKVETKKELFRVDRRRRGDRTDPFAGVRREEEIREREMQYHWEQYRIPLVQLSTQPPPPPQGTQPGILFPSQTTAPQIGFGASSGATFALPASSGSFFASPASQTTPLFGQTTAPPQSAPAFGSSAFGTAPPASSGGFFGASATTGAGFGGWGGTSPGFGGPSTFGNTGGAFSPGSSIATNFGASSFGASPNRFGANPSGNRSL